MEQQMEYKDASKFFLITNLKQQARVRKSQRACFLLGTLIIDSNNKKTISRFL